MVDQGLSPEERISLVGNEWALMRVGLHDIGDYLALGARFKYTPGYVLLYGYFDHLDYVNREIVDSADRSAFQAWLRQSFSPLLQQLGYEGHSGESPTDRQKRALLLFALGAIGDDPEVISRANSIAQQYMKDPASVDGTLARAAVRVAARHGDGALYGQYRAQLQKKLSPEAYYLFLYRLGDFPDTALAQQTLDWSLTPEVRSQDLWIVASLLENPQTRQVAWDFIRQHYGELSKKAVGGLRGQQFILYAVDKLCDAKQQAEVEEFFR